MIAIILIIVFGYWAFMFGKTLIDSKPKTYGELQNQEGAIGIFVVIVFIVIFLIILLLGG